MTNLFWCYLLIFLSFPISSFSQKIGEKFNVVPKIATVTYKLLDMPGINNEKSKWEISFELRIISEKEQYEAIKAGKLKRMQDEEKIGILISKGSFTRNNLSEVKNREISFITPISDEIQEKLRNEPKNRINLGKVELTDEVIKKSREDEAKANIFLIYANLLVYDAKLRKTTITPLSRVMSYTRYPDAIFGMQFNITENGYDIKPIISKKQTSNVITKTVTSNQ